MRSVKLSIDLGALRNNLELAKRLSSGSGAKVFAVIKANAYGHGAISCAKALDSIVDGFAVVVTGEAFQLLDSGIASQVMVIQGAQDDESLLTSAARGIQLSVHSSHQLEAVERLADQFVKPLSVWLKLDSGMGRLGFRLDEFDARLQQLRAISNVEIAGCFSHLSCADEPDNQYTVLQLEAFTAATANQTLARSLANSAAVLSHAATHLDWVRPGIMLYGANPLWPRPVAGLKPVMTVRAPFIAIRQMKKGQTIGYGNTYVCPHDMQVGVLAIGYGDGYPRHIKPGTSVLYAGRRCLILGRVSMDSLIVDLNDAIDPNVGDMATLWGEGLPVEEIADRAGTISYELLCQIRGDIEYIA